MLCPGTKTRPLSESCCPFVCLKDPFTLEVYFEILFRNKNFDFFLSKVSTFTLEINFLYSITILHLLALFMDIKPDTTNCVYRMLLPDLDNEY